MARIRVIIADDRISEREGMKSMLKYAADIELIEFGTSVPDTIEKALRLAPDVVIVDLDWFNDESGGEQIIRAVKSQNHLIRFLALTVIPSLIPGAKRAGAEQAIDKDLLPSSAELIRFVQETARMSPTPGPTPLVVRLTDEDAASQLGLKELDLHILGLHADGMTENEIAAMLYLASNTVGYHLKKLREALHARNAAELISLAYERGLLPRPKPASPSEPPYH